MFQRAVIQITAMLASLMLMQGCQLTESDTAQPSATNKPNVLWIYLEDLDPVFSPYGDPINTKEYTPTIQSMADQGVVFRTAFAPAPVCSPSRSAVITGTMPTTFGVQNHHSSRTMEDAIFLPKGVKTIPEIMREAGYATFNHGKDDYNFVYNRKDLYEDDIMIDFWYTFAGEGDWLKIAKQGKPFFGQIQTMGGKWSLDSIYPKTLTAITPVDRNAVVVPPYYPATKEVIEYSARRYDAARYTDVEVKQILDTLRTNGLLNNTYVFFFTDHGYNDSRHKQFVYDGGIQVPLIVTYFGENGQIEKGSVRNDLVSTLDLGTTTLALAGLEIPDYMEGMDLFASDYKRDQIISTRDRCDFTIDRIRAVRSKEFK